MRDLSYFVATSLNGFIAGPDGSIDWLFTDGDYGYSEFYRSVDCVVMGRKTFELSLSFPEYPYRGKRAYVFTHRTLKPPHANVVIVHDPPDAFVAELKQQTGGKIWLVGGGELGGELVQAGLVDELVLTIHPVSLGRGIPLFNPHDRRTDWAVQTVTHYRSGLVQVTYRRVQE